jgi:hypothetical protein
MNREIKFRTWYNGDGKKGMYYPTTYSYSEYFGVKKMQWLFPCSDGCSKYIVTPLMQFTGLTDKNGKEIYEGDIVKIDNCILIVCFHKGEFKMQTIEDFNKNRKIYVSICHLESSKLVGNIYENKDLLTQK